MFENVDGRTDDGRTTDAGVTGILIAHLGAFGSGELTTAHRSSLIWKYFICNCFLYLRLPMYHYSKSFWGPEYVMSM